MKKTNEIKKSISKSVTITQPTVSIIVPIYNGAEYLNRCCDSILRQSYENIEIVLVDDASCDTSLSICEMYSGQDTRVKVVHLEKNCGSLYARQIGVENALGEYITFVDCDDFIDEEMIDFFVNKMQYGYDFIATGMISESNTKIITRLNDEVIDNADRRNEYVRTLFFNEDTEHCNTNVCPSSCGKCYKRLFILNCISQVPNDIQYGEDRVTTLVCLLNTNNFACFSDLFYHYVANLDSKQHKLKRQHFFEAYMYIKTMTDILQSYNFGDELSLSDGLFRAFFIEVACTLEGLSGWRIPGYYFSEIKMVRGKKIVLYGAGKVGKDYYNHLNQYDDIEIVYWVDKKATSQYRQIYREDVLLKKCDYDIIIIAINNKNTASAIKNEMIRNGIEEEKMYWSKPKRTHRILTDCTDLPLV